MARRRPIVAALDVGTQKVAMLVAEDTGEGLEVLGVGTAPSRGMRAGQVVDVEKTAQAISVALSEAEMMSGCQIHQVTVSVSGRHIQGTNSHGVAPIDNGEVSARAARSVIQSASAVPLPNDHRVLHLMCREYVVDGHGGITDPVGMNGVRLEANLHIISGCDSALANMVKCCNKAGLSVLDVIASGLASAEAVLEPEEKEMGVALLDIGAGTTDLVVFSGGGVVHSCVLPVAGLHVTKDLARCLETSMTEAEGIKKHHGEAVAERVDRELAVEVSGVRGRESRPISAGLVADIIEPRLEEILEWAADSIVRSGFGEHLTSGLVLTGGTSMMPAMADLAARVTGLRTRVGEPLGLRGLAEEVEDPSWATAAGLLHGIEEGDLSGPWRTRTVSRLVPSWLRKTWGRAFS